MTSTRTRIAATVLAMAATVLATASPAMAATRHASSHLEWCGNRAVTYDELADTYSRGDAASWDAHLSAGWHGIAGDHAERIYPPSCTVIPYRYR